MPIGTTHTIRLSEDLNRWLEEESRATGLPKVRIVKKHLKRLRTAKARQPFLDLAGSVEGDFRVYRRHRREASPGIMPPE